MARLPVRLALGFLVLLFLAPSVWAQDKGTLTGKVTDKRTGHALPFASITVMGAQKGGLTDSEGQYRVAGITPGTYEVRVQFLGYTPSITPGVVIAPGKSVVMNFQLVEVVVAQEKEVVVSAERRLVEVRQGATVRSANAAEIRNLPVQTISEVLQQQAGIQTNEDQIHVRGGRADETVFVVNGVANRDLVTGQSSAGQLSARSVAEVNVATGAYDVRYGNALSGVVEVKLKEGTDRLSGGITYTNGSYGGRSFQAVVSGPDPIWKPLLGVVGLRVPGTMSSIVDVTSALYETRFTEVTGYEPTGFFTRMFESPDHPRLRSSYQDRFFGKEFSYGNFFTPAADNRWGLRYGLTWKPNASDKWNFNFSKRISIDQGFSRTLISVSNDSDPAFPWIWAHRIENGPTIFQDNLQTSLEWRRALSTTGFASLQFSRYFFAQRQDVMGKHWSEYEQPNDLDAYPSNDVREFDYFIDSGDDDTWQDRRTLTYSLQGNFVRRIKRHELEVGFEHEAQTVQYVTIERPWDADPDGLGSAHDLWKVHPWVGNLYARDKLEFEGFTANIGLRADYWFVGEEAERAVADPSNPNITDETRENFERDTNELFGRAYKVHFSPRLIVAHPITESSSFFFNYGEFTQNPSYRYVYSKLTSVSSEAFPLLGNPNLNPQVSVNFEVGAKYQFRERTAINATFFQKDIYDYPTSTSFQRTQGTTLVDFFVYLNGHFARSKGFEVEVEKRRSNYWSGKVSYTFQQTKGKSSDPNEQQIVEQGGGDAAETRLSETYVNWNRPHKLAVNLDLRFEDQAPENWRWLRHTGFNVYIQGISGRSYTPINLTSTQAAEPNSKNGPFQITTDARLNHKVRIGGKLLDFSLQGTNIFNNYIVNRVDRVTGKGRVWGVGEFDRNLFPTIDLSDKTARVDDPSNYGPGAQWRLGVDYDF